MQCTAYLHSFIKSSFRVNNVFKKLMPDRMAVASVPFGCQLLKVLGHSSKKSRFVCEQDDL